MPDVRSASRAPRQHQCVAAVTSTRAALQFRELGCRDYQETWEAMRAYTDTRDGDSPDQLWLLEHPPIFTLGQAGRAEHLLAPGDIPVVQTDRGGQVTYHGPGQLVCYLLLDLRRAGLGVKRLVNLLENAVVLLLEELGIPARARADAPGVYVGDAKIASVGLRVRHGCSYHGIAINHQLDLEPFGRINPCGHPGLAVTRIVDLMTDPPSPADLRMQMTRVLAELLNAEPNQGRN